jgi:hypothetical protein
MRKLGSAVFKDRAKDVGRLLIDSTISKAESKLVEVIEEKVDDFFSDPLSYVENFFSRQQMPDENLSSVIVPEKLLPGEIPNSGILTFNSETIKKVAHLSTNSKLSKGIEDLPIDVDLSETLNDLLDDKLRWVISSRACFEYALANYTCEELKLKLIKKISKIRCYAQSLLDDNILDEEELSYTLNMLTESLKKMEE